MMRKLIITVSIVFVVSVAALGIVNARKTHVQTTFATQGFAVKLYEYDGCNPAVKADCAPIALHTKSFDPEIGLSVHSISVGEANKPWSQYVQRMDGLTSWWYSEVNEFYTIQMRDGFSVPIGCIPNDGRVLYKTKAFGHEAIRFIIGDPTTNHNGFAATAIPDLACARSEIDFSSVGKTTIYQRAIKVDEVKPEGSVFVVPANYVEKSPIDVHYDRYYSRLIDKSKMESAWKAFMRVDGGILNDADDMWHKQHVGVARSIHDLRFSK